MKKYIIIAGLGLFFTNILQAHHAAVIVKKNPLVIVKADSGFHHKKYEMMKCMLCLKKHKTKSAAMQDYMTKIDNKCTKHNIPENKCNKMKKRAMFKIDKCYTTAEFFKQFFNIADDNNPEETDTTMEDTKINEATEENTNG
jgi:hypothetical protein